MKKVISLILICTLVFSSMSVTVIALDIGCPSGDIIEAIEGCVNSEQVFIIDEYVTYYYGTNYTVVKDKNGYTKIDFIDDNTILVNGIALEVICSTQYYDTNHQLYIQSQSSESEWVLYETKTTYYNVIGLAPSVVGGIIGSAVGSAVGTKIGVKAGEVFSIVGGAIVGLIVGGQFPEYYITVETNKYYELPIITQRPKTKTDWVIYHGPNSNRKENYWFTV